MPSPPSSPKPQLIGSVLLLIVAMVSLQAGSAIAKSMFVIAGPEGAVAVRLAFGALIFFVFQRLWRVRPKRAEWPALVGYGVALGVMNTCFYLALERIPLGVAVALEFTGPLVVAVANSRRLLDFLWVGIAALGLMLLLPFGGNTALDPVGVALALTAGACWGAYIVFGRRIGSSLGPRAAGVGAGVAALIAAPLGVSQAGAALLDPALIPLGLGVAVLSTVIPYRLEITALTNVPPRMFGVLMSMEPAIAALLALVLLNETLTLNQWAAMALIMAASAGVTATARISAPATVKKKPLEAER